jgi:hypothetical protein
VFMIGPSIRKHAKACLCWSSVAPFVGVGCDGHRPSQRHPTDSWPAEPQSESAGV